MSSKHRVGAASPSRPMTDDKLRALLSVECACDPRPIGGGRVYHMQDCLYARIRDYMSDEDIAAALAASATDEGPERCNLCGKPLRSGHSHGGVRVNPRPLGSPPAPPPMPPRARLAVPALDVELDPLTGPTLRGAIAAATDLINPRLSEVEWDDVAAALSYMTGVGEPAVPALDEGPLTESMRGDYELWPGEGD